MPKAPDSPWAPKAPEGKFCPLCTPKLTLIPTLTLTPTPTLTLVLLLTVTLGLGSRLELELVLGSKMESNDVAKGSHGQIFEDPKPTWAARLNHLAAKVRVRFRVMVWVGVHRSWLD